MAEDTGLEGMVYTGRGPLSQTVERTISAGPSDAQTTQNGVNPDVQSPSVSPSYNPEAAVAPVEPGPDLIGDLGKAFTKTIGSVPQTPPDQPAPVPDTPQQKTETTQREQQPKEKTWREAEPPPSLTKKAQEGWVAFRTKAVADVEARDSRIKALEEQLAASKNQAPQTEAEIGELRKRLMDAQGIVERVAVERSPLFKSKVIDQEELLKARLGKVVDGTGITPPEADAILRGNLNTRENILENRQMSAFRRQQIADLLSRWDQVAEERDRMTTRGRETLAEYLKEQQAAQESARAKFLRESAQVFEDQLALAVPKLEVYNRIEGNDAWNKSADALKTVARRLYDGNVPREMVAQAAILAPAAVAYQQLLRSAYGQIEELKGQVAKLRGVQPEVRDTGGDISQPGQILSSPNGDFVKNLVQRFQKETGLQ
jgi:hypothetical protein